MPSPTPPAPELLTLDQVLELLRAAIALEQGTSRGTAARFAQAHFFNQEYISFVKGGYHLPGPAILNALGLEKVILYRKIKS
jgi:hypothetical protein